MAAFTIVFGAPEKKKSKGKKCEYSITTVSKNIIYRSSWVPSSYCFSKTQQHVIRTNDQSASSMLSSDWSTLTACMFIEHGL